MSSNFRHHLLSLSLLVGIAAPWAALLVGIAAPCPLGRFCSGANQ
ncbi:hypothetical protein LTSEJOH_1213 [Salmonella enterica subsp. enterica serovar Johannesburg str. S5-703]|uniref:Uncharacterized protein n=1 Tax=Salmonella enterica subsp. enterica serovar Rubislaw str. A4-653 TaxID=913081 RepID=G5QFJ1_SALRU|nr:hypothetical protein LTSEJOH_1213 [Salmonella enterica subsp. enterica serovar Johannesburg str. S5-703]EHC93248.1 hypothetical protein LTSERUB_1129 [Salmonella enterica subsp. enterica serovar Rubislaw str. A4-653]